MNSVNYTNFVIGRYLIFYNVYLFEYSPLIRSRATITTTLKSDYHKAFTQII